jgi:hypothetical protein
MLARIAAHQADGQSEADYGVPKGLTLRDEIARYFRIGQALFASLTAAENPSAGATIRFLEGLLRDVFGFTDLKRIGSRTRENRQFAVTLEGLAGRVPIVVVPPADELDRPSNHLPTDGRRRSAASAIQDWLNANDASLWGLCCNGFLLRFVRDNASLTRPAYIEADLGAMFQEENFADFTALWLLGHASRFGRPGTLPSDCALERWREAGQKEGVAARDRLRDGVEAALLSFGNGFLAHPDNGALREKLRGGELPLSDFFGQLLRVVYRLIFLLAAEDRDLLHPPGTSAAARKLYAEGYSLAALRNSAVRRSAWDRRHDRWEGLLITFAALARGEKHLGLPALDGLFAPNTLLELESAKLANRSLMEAIYRLAWLRDDSGLVPINWRDMETEELGSVYESLLELTPQLTDGGRGFAFAEGGEAKGHARKTTGSYYTPDSLVQALLDSALDPVLDRVEAEAGDPAAALVSVTVLDPACGSGHFLLAAARRIATRLARVRMHGLPAPADFRHALRDVARACIHGVDRNPMAVELTKVALWIETVDPGKPLGFLDANIRCGDSLFGVFDLNVLAHGIPDVAYKPLTGDEKVTAKHFAKRNRSERDGQGALDFDGGGHLPAAAPVTDGKALRDMPEDSPEEIAAKRKHFETARADPRHSVLRIAADLYLAAFLTPKTGGVPANQHTVAVPTTGHVWDALAGKQVYAPLLRRAQDLVSIARAFHWPIEFPDVMATGGFDAVLGNPPWERIKLQEQEFFAARDVEIAAAPNAAARARLIMKLKQAVNGTREQTLYREFESTKRAAEASSVFAREGSRFPLSGRGDVNTYALFAELFSQLISKRGRAGTILPTGIALDSTTAPFFAALVSQNRLARLVDFENRKALFPNVHSAMKFSILTIAAGIPLPSFAFFLTDPVQMAEPERWFKLSRDVIAKINPNTGTAPCFRSKTDSELVTKIYERVPVLLYKSKGLAGNPWGFSMHTRIWHMAEDSEWFRTSAQLAPAGYHRDGQVWIQTDGKEAIYREYVPLYEAKMFNFYDHRFGSYGERGTDRGYRVLPQTTEVQYASPSFEPEPFYFVPKGEVYERLAELWDYNWLIACKNIIAATNERTTTVTILPKVAVAHSASLLFIEANADYAAVFVAGLNSLVLDYVARTKVGGLNLSAGLLEQFPIIPPTKYTAAEIKFIADRVLELSYTSHSLFEFARDLNYNGPPFKWDEERRAQLRAELDAWYARAYGLTSDELRYILDPSDVMGADYPSETFRVLKSNEIRRFGEYRTARLVLQAWDRMERGELAAAE